MSSHYKKYIKTKEEIEMMRENGKILATIFDKLKAEIKPGVNTWDLEKLFIKLCKKYEVRPACKGYSPLGMSPFPAGLCLSINEESVHCYPKKNKILKVGDVVTIDTSIERKGLYVDSAFSMGVGKISNERESLLSVTENAMHETIKLVKEGVKTGTLGNKMYEVVSSAGFDVLRDYAGHGIGKNMHEYPEIPCYGIKGTGDTLYEGMTICIEVLACSGNPELIHTTEWETTMRDGKDWVQFEHTVLVKKDGYDIITTR